MLEGQNFEGNPISAFCPLISLAVPVYNEAQGVRAFVEGIDAAIARCWSLDELPPRFEIVFIDDGSHDGTAVVIRELMKKDTRIRLLVLSRNFGKEAALSAGLHAAQGDAVVPMDVDLQDPPELLRPMIDKWVAGAKVVNAKRSDRSADSLFKRATSRIFYDAINMIAEHPVADNVGDFRLMDRDAVNVLNEMTEHTRFNKGLFSWIGFETETVEYVRPERAIGETKWSFVKLLRLALDGIVSSTTLPLRIWTIIGAAVSVLALCYAVGLGLYTLVQGIEVPGYASLMIVVLLLGGLNLFSLGLMGEYVGRISVQVRGRPLFVVASKEGF